MLSFIFQFELRVRWLDWCHMTGSLSGDSFERNPCFGECAVLGETAGALSLLEVGDLTDGGIITSFF